MLSRKQPHLLLYSFWELQSIHHICNVPEFLLALLCQAMFQQGIGLRDLVLESNLQAPNLSVGSQNHDSPNIKDSLLLARSKFSIRQ